MGTGQGVGTGAETGQRIGTGAGHGGITCVLQTQYSSFIFCQKTLDVEKLYFSRHFLQLFYLVQYIV